MKFTLLFSLLLASVHSLSHGPLVERDITEIIVPSCPVSPSVIQVYVYISTSIVTYPIVINTYIASNTVINIYGGYTIVINNAPTQLVTTVTATSTVTSSVTSTVTEPTATPFHIIITPAVVPRKRQSADALFVGPGGQITSDCTAASAWTLESGQLKSNNQIVSTNSSLNPEPLAVSPYPGSISTLFEFSGNFLNWTNIAFYNGNAIFCLIESVLEAVFTEVVPDGCVLQNLGTVPASSCVPPPTSTSTGSSSATSPPAVNPSAFILQASGTGVDGDYAQVISLNDSYKDQFITLSPGIANASQFSINSNGYLVDLDGEVANQDAINANLTAGYQAYLYLNPPSIIAENKNWTLPICSIGPGNIFTCAEADGRNLLQYCPQTDSLNLDSVIDTNCTEVTLTALPPSPLSKRKRRRFMPKRRIGPRKC